MASIFLLLCLPACGGGKSSTTITTPSAPSVPGPTPGDSPTASSAFGMQCGMEIGACGGGSGTLVWPTTQAQPGFLRLHDAGTYWSLLNPTSGTYDWTNLDVWLDTIDQHEPINVSQVFIWVPCWDAPTCVAPPVAQPNGTNAPPSDLVPSGSPSFNQFVTAFVQHCSPAGNCVSDIIKYYEMWNEWNQSVHWTGTPTQLYQMLAPAAAIIRKNIPDAVILMPSTTPAAQTYVQDLSGWLELENQYGIMSDWVTWHLYLSAPAPAISNPPEVQWALYAQNLLGVQQTVSNWSKAPWADTETNFDGQNSPQPYTCPTTVYSADDCAGQIVRWQLLHASNGGSSLMWYKWNQSIGSNSQYETTYFYMKQYIQGGKFGGPCSSTVVGANQIWTCNFTESGGKTAMFVWTPTESTANNPVSFTVPSGFTDYKDFSGNTTNVSAGASINIGPEPYMLEQ